MARHKPYCNHPDHVSGDLHSKQVGDRIKEIERLQAEIDAYRAQLAMYPHLDPGLADLLVYAAGTLRSAQEAADDSAASVPTDQDSGRGKPASRPPRGGDPRAKYALQRLVTTLTRGLDAWNGAKDRDWERVQVGESSILVETKED